jgi:hypothetical protein
MAKSKVKRFAMGGRSAYQGNEDSYTQASDPDASSSVDRGALTRQLMAAAAEREAAPAMTMASRDFDAMDMEAPAAAKTPNDLAESRMIRDEIAKSELESGRAKVREQDAAAAMRKPAAKAITKSVVPDAAALAAKYYKPRYTPPNLAPRTTMGRQPQPYMPAAIDNSYPGSRMKGGGKVRSASQRADGIAIRGKTRA